MSGSFRLAKQGTRDEIALLLHLGETRRLQTDTRMWQVPALSLTALAFLLSAILTTDTGWAGRLVAASLGALVLGAARMQMLKHRFHEKGLSIWLTRLEDEWGIAPIHEPDRTFASEASWPASERKRPMKGWWVEQPAHRVWSGLLLLLLVADVVFCGVAIVALACGWSA